MLQKSHGNFCEKNKGEKERKEKKKVDASSGDSLPSFTWIEHSFFFVAFGPIPEHTSTLGEPYLGSHCGRWILNGGFIYNFK